LLLFCENAASWNQGDRPQLKEARWFPFEDVKQLTDNFSEGSEIGSGGYGKVDIVIHYVTNYISSIP